MSVFQSVHMTISVQKPIGTLIERKLSIQRAMPQVVFIYSFNSIQQLGVDSMPCAMCDLKCG